MKADFAFLKYRLHFQLAASEIHLVSGIWWVEEAHIGYILKFPYL